VQVEIVKDRAYQHSGQFVAIYSVRGQVSQRGMRANLGPFGKIDARFEETSRSGGEPQGTGTCHYRSQLVIQGHLRGTIRVRGEGGFLRFATHSAPAHFARTFPESKGCEATHSEESEGFESRPRAATASRTEGFYQAIINAFGHDGRRRIFFEDETFYYADGRPAEPDSLDAGFRERRGRVDVLEHAFFEAPAHFDLLENDSGRVKATLAPPAPFSGAANFTRAGKGRPAQWTGPLTISLPGAPDIPLSGPHFFSDLCTKEATFRCHVERSRYS
jgi:hypothetical protein